MKIAVVYWSGTGNTEQMAELIAEGAKAAGAEVRIDTVGNWTTADALSYDRIAFGCPAMGAEQLEEVEFEPFYTDIENDLKGKKILLFGSYSWADGEWMRTWEERARDKGADIFDRDGVICFEAPDAEKQEELKKLGENFAK